MSKHRAARVADEIRSILARALQEEVRDPGIGFVTVTEVQLSRDLRNARVFVSILGEEKQRSLEALDRAGPFLRRALAHQADLRFTPELKFIEDESLDTGLRVAELLEQAGASDLPPESEDGDPS